ncbi:hypothetical protein [Methanosphaera cuniculi]|uniref:hypothetical protein n=1 Tax=Methanosphaera cuniculi TaxID=1077256 RepID=UPI0026EE844F|nr:hypothetical protein [Methanosphaera cuniculi]
MLLIVIILLCGVIGTYAISISTSNNTTHDNNETVNITLENNNTTNNTINNKKSSDSSSKSSTKSSESKSKSQNSYDSSDDSLQPHIPEPNCMDYEEYISNPEYRKHYFDNSYKPEYNVNNW